MRPISFLDRFYKATSMTRPAYSTAGCKFPHFKSVPLSIAPRAQAERPSRLACLFTYGHALLANQIGVPHLRQSGCMSGHHA